MDNNNSNNNNGRNQKGPQTFIILAVAAIITLMLFSFINNLLVDSSKKQITYNEFLEMVDSGQVKSVEIGSDSITIVPSPKSDNKDSVLTVPLIT